MRLFPLSIRQGTIGAKVAMILPDKNLVVNALRRFESILKPAAHEKKFSCHPFSVFWRGTQLAGGGSRENRGDRGDT